MKKTVLLSVVASTMIMAGGDIAPVAAPVAPVEVSGWDFSGQAAVYYQTIGAGDFDLFEQDASAADAGIQLKAVNKDVFAGIGRYAGQHDRTGRPGGHRSPGGGNRPIPRRQSSVLQSDPIVAGAGKRPRHRILLVAGAIGAKRYCQPAYSADG